MQRNRKHVCIGRPPVLCLRQVTNHEPRLIRAMQGEESQQSTITFLASLERYHSLSPICRFLSSLFKMSAEADVKLQDFKNIFSLEGKVAVVTGGSRGLGLHAASGYEQHQLYIQEPQLIFWCQSTTGRLLQSLHHISQGEGMRRSHCSAKCLTKFGQSLLDTRRPFQT